jgi:hypothetical protein
VRLCTPQIAPTIAMSLLGGAADRKELWSVSSLPEAVALYGFAPTDRITRREQVTIFHDIARSIAAKKEELVIAGEYSSIKELDLRLQSLRTAFQQLQLQDVAADSAKQQALYADARGKILQVGLYTECVMSVFGMCMHELGRYARYCQNTARYARYCSICSVRLY